MADYPRLHSLSTVCLLKHYNQDYLLHPLRTDFTGSNGVGKSIIADLFQVVFIADKPNIKFATEGINKKKRMLETLPYQSGIGYAFFNVEVDANRFITIGAAIFSQGNNIVKSFIVTSCIDLQEPKIEQHTFTADKLLFSRHFLKTNKEPYTLDELSRNAPSTQLYVHAFETREERTNYYGWLYRNNILPINLVKEGNLKAFAKVIQSFSKSKSLDIDNSKSLIEYLFEEDEKQIVQEYNQQEQSINKLLHQFKTTKQQIADIESKQADLKALQEIYIQKQAIEFDLDKATLIDARIKHAEKETAFKDSDKNLRNKKDRLQHLTPRSEKFLSIVTKAQDAFSKENKTHEELAKNQALFGRLEELQEQEEILMDVNVSGLLRETPEKTTDLLAKDAKAYEANINKSKGVLKRYTSIAALEEKKEHQDQWVKARVREIEKQEEQLTQFYALLTEATYDSLFAQTLAQYPNLNTSQLATLVHLRTVTLNKPNPVAAGARYTESKDFIQKLEILAGEKNEGWWIKTGMLNEYVSPTSLLLPDFASTKLSSVDQLKTHLSEQIGQLKQKKNRYTSLQKGIVPEGFSEYDYDIDLRDNTQVEIHITAAYYCGLLEDKLSLLKTQKREETTRIEDAKKQYGIADLEIDYGSLLKNISDRKEHFRKKHTKLHDTFHREQKEITTLTTSLPTLESQHEKLTKELEETRKEIEQSRQIYERKYPEKPIDEQEVQGLDVAHLATSFSDTVAAYINLYNQVVGKHQETKDGNDFRVTEQVTIRNYNFEILEQALLGPKVKTLDGVTAHLDQMNTDLLSIADELMKNITKVFGKTEEQFDKYKTLVGNLNDFFRGKLISERFYFRIDFNPAPKLDIKWIEHLRKSAQSIAANGNLNDTNPQQFIEGFYTAYSGNKTRISIEDLLNPKSYFTLKGKLTDENDREIPGSTGESYTAIALLGIARLSVVQDGDRAGLRFIILEESATLDNVNFGMFPEIAKKYHYQIITMTPRPYAVGGIDGWYLHQLIPGKENRDINYPTVMSYFRTEKAQIELSSYLK